MEKVFEIYIKTTPERLWEAITDPELRSRYSFGIATESDWTPGSGYRSGAPGIEIAAGKNLEVDPPRRLVQSFNALWGDDVRAEADLAGHLGDRADRRLVPADRHPRPAAQRVRDLPRRQPATLRRLADDPLRAEDAARDRRAADHPGIAALLVVERRGDLIRAGVRLPSGPAYPEIHVFSPCSNPRNVREKRAGSVATKKAGEQANRLSALTQARISIS